MSAEFNPNNLFSAQSAQSPEAADADDLMWELLSLYVDGEASPEEAVQVEQMLRHDAEYARAYSFMQQTSGVVRAIVEVEPPAFLHDAILAKTSHRLTLAQRLSAGIATLRTQLALPQMGRWALAGGSLAACALLVGVFTARPADNGTIPVSNIASAAMPSVPANSDSPTRPEDGTPPTETVVDTAKAVADANPAQKTVPVAHTFKIDLKGLHEEPPIAPPVLAAVRKTMTVLPSDKKNLVSVAYTKPSRTQAADGMQTRKQPQDTVAVNHVSDSIADTQSVSPMMDANVQHRQLPPMQVAWRTDDDLDRDVVANNGDSGSVAPPTILLTDGDNAPKGRLVGKLQLSKLPPTARHLQTAADIQRIQEARNMGYTASAMDGMQRREADVTVISGKF